GARTAAGWRTTSKPATLACPRSKRSSVASARTAVVLPAPLGPSTPYTVPAGTARQRSSRAFVRPYCLLRPSATTAKSPFMPAASPPPLTGRAPSAHRGPHRWSAGRRQPREGALRLRDALLAPPPRRRGGRLAVPTAGRLGLAIRFGDPSQQDQELQPGTVGDEPTLRALGQRLLGQAPRGRRVAAQPGKLRQPASGSRHQLRRAGAARQPQRLFEVRLGAVEVPGRQRPGAAGPQQV